MSDRDDYTPGPAGEARIEDRTGDLWTFVLERELRHPPEKVWRALTGPALLRAWAPFDSDRSLDAAGTTAMLTTVGAPKPHVTETTVRRADAPRFLEFNWGDGDLRWELKPIEGGTRLTLWANIDHRWIAMGATGWHIALDVLDRFLAGTPIGRLTGPTAMSVDGFRRLHAEYAEKFGVEVPSW